MSLGDFFNDVGDFGKSLFTGRWTGGENSVGDVWNRDPAAVIAPLALATGGAALGAGALAGGVAEGGALAAEGAAEAGTFTDVGIAEVGGAYTPLEGSSLSAAEGSAFGNPEFMTAYGMETPQASGSIDAVMAGQPAMGPQGAGPGGPISLSPDAAGAGSGSWMDSITGYAKAHPFQTAGVAAAGGLLGYDLLKGNPKGANVNNEQGLADTTRGMTQEMYASGKQLESYLINGNLPKGMQSQVDSAVKAAKAAAISNAAKNGQNTNPTQNTQLAQALSDADMRGLQLAADLETKLFSAGTNMVNNALTATGMTSKMYEWLTAQDNKTNEDIQKAIMAFAAAAGGGGGKGGLNLNFGGSKST